MKKGDQFKDKNGSVIICTAIFKDQNIISGFYRDSFNLKNLELFGDEKEYGYFSLADLTFYKSAECSEVLHLMDSSEDANYCQSLKTVLAKYPKVNREKLEEELNQFV